MQKFALTAEISTKVAGGGATFLCSPGIENTLPTLSRGAFTAIACKLKWTVRKQKNTPFWTQFSTPNGDNKTFSMFVSADIHNGFTTVVYCRRRQVRRRVVRPRLYEHYDEHSGGRLYTTSDRRGQRNDRQSSGTIYDLSFSLYPFATITICFILQRRST